MNALALAQAALALLGSAGLWWALRRTPTRGAQALLLAPPTFVLALACMLQLTPQWRWPLSLHAPSWSWLPWALAVAAAWWLLPPLSLRLGARRSGLHALALGMQLAALALWLSDPHMLWWGQQQLRVVVWDDSLSAERAGADPLRREAELRLAERSMQPGDQLALIEFASRAQTTIALHAHGEPSSRLQVDLGREGTDIEAALRRALAELPSEQAARVVLVSDGVETRGDALRASLLAQTRGVPIDTVLLPYTREDSVELHAVRAPSVQNAERAFDLRLELSSPPQPSEVTLRLLRDGELLERRRARLLGGHDVLNLPLRELEPGLHRYEVQLERDGVEHDPHAAQRRSAYVDVRGKPTALWVHSAGLAAAPVRQWLQDAGFTVQEPGLPPQDASGWASADLVVLQDLSAAYLGPAAMRALAQAVEDGGTGLLWLGSAQAFGPGGFSQTPLERISPLDFDLKKNKRRAALAEVISIDYSGSMSAQVGKVTKLDLANEAAFRSAALLAPGDWLGVAHVDTVVAWTVPLAPVGADVEASGKAIRAVQVGGGGIDTEVALAAAYQKLRGTPEAMIRHVLLFADGDDAENIGRCAAMAQHALRVDRITTSAVSLGRGTDSAALETISRLGNGRFYLVEDATVLPEIFSQETVLASQSAFREEEFSPRLAGDAGYLRGVRALPNLRGYVSTVAKPGARLSLIGLEDEPLLADHSAGLGKVSVLTTDFNGRWSAEWVRSAEATRLLAQVAQHTARSPWPGGSQLHLSGRGGALHLEAIDPQGSDPSPLRARVLQPDGHTREVELNTLAAGRHEAQLDGLPPGSYLVSLLRAGANGQASLLARASLELSRNDELAPRSSNRALLERLSAQTGGQPRTTLEDLFAGERSWHAQRSAVRWPLAGWCALWLLVQVAARRWVMPRRRAVPQSQAAQDAATTLAALQRKRPAHAAPQAKVAAHAATLSAPTAHRASTPSSHAPSNPAASTDATASGPTTASPPAARALSSAELLAARRRRKH